MLVPVRRLDEGGARTVGERAEGWGARGQPGGGVRRAHDRERGRRGSDRYLTMRAWWMLWPWFVLRKDTSGVDETRTLVAGHPLEAHGGGLPPLAEAAIVGLDHRLHVLPAGPDVADLRSRDGRGSGRDERTSGRRRRRPIFDSRRRARFSGERHVRREQQAARRRERS